MTRESIGAIMVKLDVEDRQALFIVLADDGLVNRLGTGAVDSDENDLFIGRTNEPLFAQLKALIRPQWLEHFGAYDAPSKAGSTCTLSVLFKTTTGQEGGIRLVYSSESQGPPSDIREFVMEAARLTDPWYKKQKRMTAGFKEEQAVVAPMVRSGRGSCRHRDCVSF
jgi:hypothetical protein